MGERIDLHIHTEESVCSTFSYSELKERIRALRLHIATATDHGSAKACLKLKREMSDVLIIPGIEVTAQEGDFIVFTADIEYLKTLGAYVGSVKDLRRDEETVVIWAHPRIPHRFPWTEPSPQKELIEKVLPLVDAVEIFNGHILEMTAQGFIMPLYYKNLAEMAESARLALTAGSDTHDGKSFMKCWTEIEAEVKSELDFIAAIRSGKTKPNFDAEFYGLDPRALLNGA